MMVGDMIIGISQKETPLVISALVMAFIATAMLIVVNKKR